MSHWRNSALAVGVALAAQWASHRLFDGVEEVAQRGLLALRDGIPWAVVVFGGTVCLAGRVNWGLYGRNKALGWLAVWGLIALHYLGLAIAHPPGTALAWAAGAAAAVSLVFLAYRFGRHEVDIYDRGRKPLTPATSVRYKAEAVRHEEIQARPGLILFLSFLTKPPFVGKPTRETKADGGLALTEEWKAYKLSILAIVAEIRKGNGYRLDNRDLLKPFGRANIRMPLEAIRLQIELRELRQVAIIPSRDTPKLVQEEGGGAWKSVPSPYTGSHDQVEFFEQVCAELYSELALPMPKFHVAAAADFELTDEIAQSIRDARAKLAAAGATSHYLDLTGGQALCSVVGAIRSLRESDRCLYISTRDYRAKDYDFIVDRVPEVG